MTKAYKDPSTGTLTSSSVVAVMTYDGKGRRMQKQVQNSADRDCTYAFYHDADSIIETRNGSDLAIKQQVCGTQYIDETTTSPSPRTSRCDSCIWSDVPSSTITT